MTCLTPPGTGLAHTPEDALDLVKQSLSPNTTRAYYGWLCSFETFCDGNEPHTNGVSDRPLSPVSVRRIIQRRAKEAGLTERFSGHSFRCG